MKRIVIEKEMPVVEVSKIDDRNIIGVYLTENEDDYKCFIVHTKNGFMLASPIQVPSSWNMAYTQLHTLLSDLINNENEVFLFDTPVELYEWMMK